MATILDSFVGSFLGKMQEIITDKAILILGVKEELTELQRRMTQIQSCLNDAEQRRIEELAVNNWLVELKDFMYDADDIIDLARSKGRKLLGEDQPPSSSLSLQNSTTCSGLPVFSCFQSFQTRHKVAIRIKRLNDRFDKISKDKESLKLDNAIPTCKVFRSNQRQTSDLEEPNLVGKEIKYATTRLVNLVIEHKDNKDYKLAIVGTGGVGKTTLAQKIYNDQRIKGNFSKQSWICVSQQYSEIALLKEVLRNIGVHYEQDESIGELQSKLARTIHDKSLFLVLDDVWQPEVWTNMLRTPLHAAAAGVILVTTRDDTVATRIGMEHMHRVELMSVDVGWELLWNSMNIKEEKEVQNLKDVGIEIVRKCGCLPLAIKAISSVLAAKEKTKNQWEMILRSSAWSMSKLPIELSGALYLSYNELPRNLKQCFLYCALYPEDSIIFRDDIVRLWIAEGFIEEQEDQLLEETAEEYYYDLIFRNLLQPDPLYFDHCRCKMHDLLWQLAHYLSKEECFVGDTKSLEAKTMCRLRRICAVTEEEVIVFPSIQKEKPRVRTFRVKYPMSRRIENSIFMRFPLLRVLDLTNSHIQSIPNDVKSLVHLRLLDLDGTDISCLPESISYLKNLQILNLQSCRALHKLPLAITQLYNLRRLGLDDTPINQVPKGIGNLAFLNSLQGFPVGCGFGNTEIQDGWGLQELEPLFQLRKLKMVGLERAVPCGKTSLLIGKRHLKFLRLGCTKSMNVPRSEEDISNIENVLEELIPPSNLEQLNIMNFFGQKYPTWLSTPLPSVESLQLINCISCGHLPPIGQLPNLKYLRIQGASAVTRIGPELLGCGVVNAWSLEAAAFPKLEWLIIEDMPNWEEWSFTEKEEEAAAVEEEEDGAAAAAGKQKGEAPPPKLQLLPTLKELYLVDCPKLRALPQQLAQATRLKELLIRSASCLKAVEDLPFLSVSLEIHMCKGLDRVSNLPQVRELYVGGCPNLRRVEEVGSLQQLWLSEDVQKSSPLWVSELQQQHQEIHSEVLDLYTWGS